MNYFVIRDGQQYGPYSLADLQRYVAEGNIAPTDQARSEAMEQPVAVQQIIGNIPAQPWAGAQQSYGQVPGYVPAPEVTETAPAAVPPGLHWGLVLLFTIVTFGLFSWIWMFVQASFVRKIMPTSRALVWYAIALPGLILGGFVVGALGTPEQAKALGGFVQLGFVIVLLVGHFSLRSSLEEYYTRVENIHLHLSGVMTFFFNTTYFQYHLNSIRRWKQTGVLS